MTLNAEIRPNFHVGDVVYYQKPGNLIAGFGRQAKPGDRVTICAAKAEILNLVGNHNQQLVRVTYGFEECCDSCKGGSPHHNFIHEEEYLGKEPPKPPSEVRSGEMRVKDLADIAREFNKFIGKSLANNDTLSLFTQDGGAVYLHRLGVTTELTYENMTMTLNVHHGTILYNLASQLETELPYDWQDRIQKLFKTIEPQLKKLRELETRAKQLIKELTPVVEKLSEAPAKG